MPRDAEFQVSYADQVEAREGLGDPGYDVEGQLED